MLADVLAGLQSVHDLKDSAGSPLNLVHRDVSPHNVMISYDGHAKLLDFGISKSSESTHQTSTGILKGKLAYMAPEQARFEAVDHRVDLFAVGAMLWEVLYGRRMWDAVPDAQILLRLVRRELPPPPEETTGPIPQALKGVLARAIAADAADRYATANDFAGDLESVIETLPRVESSRRGMTALLAEHFGVQRERRRKIVEEAIAKASVASTGEFQSIVRMAAAQTGETSSRIEAVTQSEKTVEPDAYRSSAPALVANVEGAPIRRGRMLAFGIGSAAMMLLAVGIGSQVGSPRTPTSDQPANVPPIKDTTLRVNVLPGAALAHVWLDGREVPFGIEVSVPRDAREHSVVVQADGYERYVTNVRFDGPNTVQVSLLPVAATALSTIKPASSGVALATSTTWKQHPLQPSRPTATPPTAVTAIPPTQTSVPSRPAPDDPAPHRPDRPILDTLGK